MSEAILCARCGAPLPPHASSAVVTCAFCGTSAEPAPKVIERVVDRVFVVQAKGAGQGASLACPRCAEATRRVEVRDEVVYVCPSCAGALLATSQVKRLETMRDDDLVSAARRAVPIIAPSTRRQAALSCPSCASPLRTREVEGTVYLHHTCDAHGTFFERGALEAFVEMWTARRAGEISDDDLKALGLK